MGYEFKHTITGAPIAGGEASPNTTPPAADRIWDVPLHVRGDMGIGVFGVLEDGTFLAIAGVWIRDETTGFWAELATSISLLPGIASQPAALPPGAKMFVQLGAAVGGPTKVHFGFIELANVDFLAGEAGTVSVAFSTALEASKVIRASAGQFYGYSCRLDATAPSGTYYVQLLDAATPPANGAVTHVCGDVKVVHALGVDDYPFVDLPEPKAVANGAVLVLSSTEFTKTISGAYLSLTEARHS